MPPFRAASTETFAWNELIKTIYPWSARQVNSKIGKGFARADKGLPGYIGRGIDGLDGTWLNLNRHEHDIRALIKTGRRSYLE